MPDFRDSFYHHYVSKFKESGSQLDGDAVNYYFRWCEDKYLPLFKGMGPDANILELGCGPGYMLEFLRRQGYRYVKGIDISKEQVDLAKERGCDAEVINVSEFLGRTEEVFDAIIALDFIEHFQKEELIPLVQLIFKSLNNGGRLILHTPNGAGLFPGQIIYGDLTHLTIFTPHSMKQLLKAAGFNNFAFYETTLVPRNILGGFRLLLWKMIKFFASSIRRIETGKVQTIWTENMICACEKSIS